MASGMLANHNKCIIDQIVEIIKNNIENPELDVNYIADQLHLSRASLYRKVKPYLSIGIHELITQIRITEAIHHINNDTSIGEIAIKVGYQHPDTFSKVFKRRIGKAPSQLKSRNMANIQLPMK